MDSGMITGLIAIAAFAVILNGFAAGVVAIAYFWRDAQGVMKRAVIGALGSGIASFGLASGVVLTGGSVRGDGLAMISIGIGVFVVFGTLISLPGAYILSRKIGSRQRVDPDVFS